MSSFGYNIFDFGAKGDGITDDTAAIQRAIDFCAERGGGRICFPYTPNGYRVASPAREEYNGIPVRAQIIIPPGNHNIILEGEMPCRMLYPYIVRPLGNPIFPPTVFGDILNVNTFIFSDWDAPEEHDPNSRPWSIIAAPQGTLTVGRFSVHKFSIQNLEFRVHMDQERMYPTQSCVNLQNVVQTCIMDSQFCLNETIGDTVKGKEIQLNPCHVAGLILPADQNDNVVLRNVAVQGFRYGIVAGEHIAAEYLYIHNCEEGITFHDCSHLSTIAHIVAQHNTTILTTTRGYLYGMKPGPCYVLVGGVDIEDGKNSTPKISELQYLVYDPDNRLHGSLNWHNPHRKDILPTVCSELFAVNQIK